MKKKKYQRGGFEQGFRAREDESLGMRTGPERAKLQDMAARRADSYGAWGRRPNQMINRQEGGVGSKGYGKTNDRDIIKKTYDRLTPENIRPLPEGEFDKLSKILHKVLDKTPISTKEREFARNFGKNAKGGVASFDVGGTAEEIAEAEAKPSVYQPKHKGEGGPNLDATMLLRKGRAIARIEGGDRHEELVEIAEGKWNVEFESLMDNQGSEIDPDLKKRMRSMQEGFNANFLGGVQNVGTATVIEGHDSASSLGETDKARGMGAAVKGTGFKGVF